MKETHPMANTAMEPADHTSVGEKAIIWLLIVLAFLGSAVITVIMFLKLLPQRKNLVATASTAAALTAAQQAELEKWTKICLYISYGLCGVLFVLGLVFLIGKFKIFEFDLPIVLAWVVVGVQTYILFEANKDANAIDLTNATGATTVSACVALRTYIMYLLYVTIGLTVLALAIAILFGVVKHKKRGHKKVEPSVETTVVEAAATTTAPAVPVVVVPPPLPPV